MIVEKAMALVCMLIEMAVRKVSVTVEYKLIVWLVVPIALVATNCTTYY